MNSRYVYCFRYFLIKSPKGLSDIVRCPYYSPILFDILAPCSQPISRVLPHKTKAILSGKPLADERTNDNLDLLTMRPSPRQDIPLFLLLVHCSTVPTWFTRCDWCIAFSARDEGSKYHAPSNRFPFLFYCVVRKRKFHDAVDRIFVWQGKSFVMLKRIARPYIRLVGYSQPGTYENLIKIWSPSRNYFRSNLRTASPA